VLDGVSLDQLRAFIAAVNEGSFSAGARRLHRTQSAVSELVSNLEAQLGVVLFDRSERYPKLTPAGVLLVADARSVVANVGLLKARAKGISGGLESELSAVVDVFFPIQAIAESAREFRDRFPHTPLRLYVEALGGAYQPVIDGRCSFGVVGSLPIAPDSMTVERLQGVDMAMVAAREHPLALLNGVLPKTELAKHVQLVLTDRSELTVGREFGVMSPLTWRLGDLYAKHAFLLKGLGWGGMPLHTVRQDLLEGRLAKLSIEDLPDESLILPMSAVYLTANPPGPAGRWLIERLRQCPDQGAAGQEVVGPRSREKAHRLDAKNVGALRAKHTRSTRRRRPGK
jgi:DNA-binding transcriptional LysR family regulator